MVAEHMCAICKKVFYPFDKRYECSIKTEDGDKKIYICEDCLKNILENNVYSVNGKWSVYKGFLFIRRVLDIRRLPFSIDKIKEIKIFVIYKL